MREEWSFDGVVAAPGNLRATVNGTTVRLDWDPLAEVVSSYVIQAGSASGLSNLANFNTGQSVPALVVENVPPGVFYVRVRAIGPDGIPGPPSNEVVVTVTLTCGGVPPGPVLALTSQVAGNQVSLGWGAPNTGGPAAAYIVEAGSASGSANVVVFDTGTLATSLMAVAPTGLYYVRVRARNSCGVGAASNESIVPVGVDAPPTTTTTTTTSTTTTTIPGSIIHYPAGYVGYVELAGE